jgi:hypothetical protein
MQHQGQKREYRKLCKVRAGQYWRLENLNSFDDFLARRFPESRRKAYYLMSGHEHPPQAWEDLKEVGWTKGLELAKIARSDGSISIVQPGCTKRAHCRRRTLGGRWRSFGDLRSHCSWLWSR